MIINKLNNVSNQSFKAILGPNLQAEIDNKRKTLERLPNRKRSISVSKFDSYIQEIKNILPSLSIEIDKNNPNEYFLQYAFSERLTLPVSKKFLIRRNKDKNSYQYSSLRNGLKILDKFVNKIKTHNFTESEKEELRKFEASILGIELKNPVSKNQPHNFTESEKEELRNFEASILGNELEIPVSKEPPHYFTQE